MASSRQLISFLALTLGSSVSSSVLAESGGSVTEQNREFIAQAFEHWAEGRGSFFQDVLSPDVVWTIKGSGPSAGTFHTRDAFIDQAVAPFAARLSSFVSPRVNSIWADGNDVLVYWDGAAIAADGVPYNNSFVWIFRMEDLRAVEVTAFLDLNQYEDVIDRIPLDRGEDYQMNKQVHSYVGMWVTDDDHIRHQLLPNGRYDEARGSRESAYQGRYEIRGNHIYYWDDAGFTADGVFVDEDTLHHAGMIFHRQQ